jgi:hypothetical protein
VRRAAAWAAALAAALLVGGCSTTRVAYQYAEVYLRWKGNQYLDLHGAQRRALAAQIHDFQAWHRSRALPQYARLAREAAARIDAGLSPADIVWGYDSIMTQAGESLREAAQRLAPLLDRLTPEQVAHLEQRFAEENRKFAKENMTGSDAERRDLRVKRTRERLEDWVGSLSESQLRRVREFAGRAPLLDELADRDRERLQVKFLDIVRRHQARERLADAAVNWRRGREPAYAAASDAYRREYFALLLDLERSLSPAQRERLLGHVRQFAQDFSALAAAG